MLYETNKIKLWCLVFLSFIFVFFTGFSLNAYAAKEEADPGLRKVFSEEICPTLVRLVPNTSLKRYCVSYQYQEDLDNAYKKICDVHGAGGTKKLEAECNEYKNFVKGSFKPVASDGTYGADPASEKCDNHNCDFVRKYINPAINLFTYSFIFIAIISLIIGGIQYSASAGDPQAVSKGKKRITDTLIAVVAYFFLYAFLQFLVPGGLFNR